MHFVSKPSGQSHGPEGTLAAPRRLTFNSGISRISARAGAAIGRQDSQSPSNLSRERLLVGGKRAFGVGDVDAGAKKGAPSWRALFLFCTNYNLSLITKARRSRRNTKRSKKWIMEIGKLLVEFDVNGLSRNSVEYTYPRNFGLSFFAFLRATFVTFVPS
jgi:hypothetical protein